MSPTEQMAEMERRVGECEETMRVLLAAEDAQSVRITRMLHDDVGQYVAALQLGLRGLQRELDMGADVKLTLQSLHAISQSVGEELHKVALELRPSSLDDYGLVLSLTTFLDRWAFIAGATIDFDHAGLEENRLPRHLETNLFRIIRDMLHVVSAQARVTRVSVMLHRKQSFVVSIVEHDGGHDRESDFLATLKARIALLKGTFTVEDSTLSGRTLIARVPINHKG